MSTTKDSPASINAWLEEELYQQYLNNVKTVDEEWRHVFEESGAPAARPAPETRPVPAAEPEAKTTAVAVEAAEKPITVGPGEQLVPLRGAAARLAENMNQSLRIPTATSQRVIPVKVIDENRIILNQHRTLLGKSKISYTHIVAWAIVKAIETLPNINSAYAESDGEPFRIVRPEVNLGVAVDLPGKDGARQLVVPNIKNVHSMNFLQFIDAYDDLVVRARSGKLQLADFQGTTLSLTNPGTIGTVGSVPRLMPGQGAIIATGAIDYPAEYQGTAPEMRAFLGLSKVMTVTCTYDHRVIQGAESGMFLARLHALIQGSENFYEHIFAALRIPYQPVKWNVDQRPALPGAVSPEGARSEVAKEAAVLQMINAYRVRGHLIADLDPLGGEPQYHPELDPASYGLSIWDLDRHFHPGNLGHFTGDAAPKGSLTLREILEVLRQTYCGKVGCEYMNIQIPEQKAWLQERMERAEFHAPLAPEVKKRILERIVEAEMFENFLHTRFIGQKRFSMEGGETAIAILDEVLECAANEGVHEAVMGMAHRGRLTVLANLIGKTLTQIFSEFEGAPDPDSVQGSGDVKYHLGAAGVRTSTQGKEIVVSVAPNPSHLEAVDPVVEGIVRPKQERLGDTKRERVIPILIHGDAAFAGQGVVAETLNLSQLEGYHTGGTVHLIINNQIGFTTNPQESRSTPYCTDVARMVQAPIFHVNGDHPESAFRVAKLAYEFRQQFKKDVVIDMLCYRKHGHNEGDDPSYTQPVVYRKIKDHVPVAAQYAERLMREGVIDPLWLDALRKRISLRLEEGFQSSKQNAEKFEFEEMAWLDEDELRPASFHTPISEEMAARVVRGITAFPEDFRLHPKLKGFIDKRREVLDGAPIDWAMGEALAFGSLVLEGTPVRLSGQDCSRGTFSQRHSAYFDYDTGREYVPLKNLSPEQARFEAVDSSLSEYAVMGFEFGYSVADPTTLVLWEAQFGDFVNGAQIMIDQFVSACEAKWGQPSGLVLLLPHGYEGQGPEHSSARIERFLQLCAENNMIVANCTTPAQYFHLLRRQMYGGRDRRG
ncbi:MAG: multifunctional oxoglutarate decarboxylase/oxoglutarate dehydrogenase thiamine pyrophosphate-binding subunit/dihydrolipoyllysine-residue succinyltransferase subunit, partial [Bryobacter sp.]|nr:multifunctional oxoglutarate decarboxylase/oxoglutarate dehydrogenase thiamine pyrophosphate-binding subunit/dihydrolipoyllysine-residue succinyltransferase subunit [Bryobacter sp.]